MDRTQRPRPINVSGMHPVRPRERLFARSPGAVFDVRAGAGVTEILVYDEIGSFGISAAAFRDRLRAAPGNVVVRINSPGGDVFDGIAMHNDLLGHPSNVRIEITGIAASAASIIAMAGHEIAIAQNAQIMIHESWGFTVGNASDHLDQASILQKVDRAIAQTYAARTGLSLESILEMMAEETWMLGEEAKENGFATEILPTADIQTRFDLSLYSKAPAALTQSPGSQPVIFGSRTELERALHERMGLARGAAKKIAAVGWRELTGVDYTAIEAITARLAAATAELAKIRRN